MLYFSYGANMGTFQLLKRGVQLQSPGRAAAVADPALCLTFQHRGAFATLAQCDVTNSKLVCAKPHGVLYDITEADFRLLAASETGYWHRKMQVVTYDGQEHAATAFVSKRSLMLKASVQPTSRYVELLRTGAREHNVAAEYEDWLSSVPSVEGVALGPEYFDTPSELYTRCGIAAVLLAIAFVFFH